MKASVLAHVMLPAAAARAGVTFTFAQGLQPNSDYVVALIARDTFGNCQASFQQVALHTADNIPPTTLSLVVANVSGTTADLHLQLDEPGTAFFVVIPATGGDCPAASDIFATGASGTTGNNAAGAFRVPSRAPTVAVASLKGLQSETTYAACVVAQDATQLRNNQSAPVRAVFRTLDVTPPDLAINLAAGLDGDVTCLRTAPYLCNTNWTATLSEPGSARWVLLHNTSALPAPDALLSQPLTAMFPGATVVAEGNLTFPPSPSAVVSLSAVPSKAAYVLVAAAHDDASPLANVAPVLLVLPVRAPDVEPPNFVNYGLVVGLDTTLNFTVSLDEGGTIAYVLVPSPSTPPRAAGVFLGTHASGASPAAGAGNVSCTCSPNCSAVFSVSGLQPGQRFDLHMAAMDLAHNVQPLVATLRCGNPLWGFRCGDSPPADIGIRCCTPIFTPRSSRPVDKPPGAAAPSQFRGVRTTDSTPPVITQLEASWSAPMSLTINAIVSKPGALRFALRHASQPRPASGNALLDVVAANNLAVVNFTGTMVLPQMNNPVASGWCIADGGGMVVDAVAQDHEGAIEGRWPNNSTFVRCGQPSVSWKAGSPERPGLEPLNRTFPKPSPRLQPSSCNPAAAGKVTMQRPSPIPGGSAPHRRHQRIRTGRIPARAHQYDPQPGWLRHLVANSGRIRAWTPSAACTPVRHGWRKSS